MFLKTKQAPAYREGLFVSIPISRCRRCRQQLLQRPLLRRNPGLDRWRGLDRHVLSAPVVPREIQAEHCIVIASLLAKRIRQPSVPAKSHAGCQIEPLHSAGSDFMFGNVAADHRFGEACYRPRCNSLVHP